MDKNKIENNKAISKVSTRSMAFSTFLVMLGLVFSKGSGFLRDIFVGIKFSEPIYRDSFTLAFTIPDLVYNLLIGGSIQAAITPSLAASINKGEEKKGIGVVSIFISVFAVIMLVVCALGMIFADFLYSFYDNNGNSMTAELAAKAGRMLFPQIFFMMLAALSIGILNAYKRFGSTSFGPTIYNMFVLFSIILFAGNSEKNLVYTTTGIMCAALIYFLFQYIVGRDVLSKFKFRFDPLNKEFHALFKRALPILISMSIVQINTVVLNYFTTFYEQSGQAYALRNASTIWQLPYGIFAVAIGNVMLPTLAALYSEGKFNESSELLSTRLKTALFMTIPSTGLLIVFNTNVVLAIFQWSNEYTLYDAIRAGSFLIGYSPAVIIHTVVFIMNQAFYAIGNTKIPLLAGSVGLITNPLLCYIFVTNNYGPICLTITYTITSLIQMSILLYFYYKDKRIAPTGIKPFIIKSFICVFIMIIFGFVIDRIIPVGFNKLISLVTLGIKFLLCIAVYFILAFILKIKEAVYWITRVKTNVNKIIRKFAKK